MFEELHSGVVAGMPKPMEEREERRDRELGRAPEQMPKRGGRDWDNMRRGGWNTTREVSAVMLE